MKRRCASLVLLSLFCGVGALADADQAFENLGEEYLADLANFSPVTATLIGDHRADDKLDQVNARARKKAREMYQEYKKALDAIDRDQLSRANQVDAALLGHKLDAELWSMDTLQEWAWDPLVYVNIAGSSIYGLVARDFAPLDSRLKNVTARLTQLARFFAQARASLDIKRVPKVHAETAVAQNQGLLSIIDAMVVPGLAGLSATDRAELEAAIEVARDAIAEHQSWLENELLPNAAGDFRIGAALFDKKLAFALDSSLDRRAIRARAEAEYENVRNQMYTNAQQVYTKEHPYTYFPDNPDEAFKQVIIRAALEQAYQHLPPADGIVELAKEQLRQASNFVMEHNIVEMPDEPVDVIVMPEFQRGVSVAYLDPPGPLDKEQSAFYAVAPLPEDWTPEQVTSFLREYNVYSMQNLTLHEGVPGHYLQLALSNRYPSTLRSVFWSGPFVEGWAVYSERVMIDAGYLDNDPLMRLINLKWYLRGITNAILDSAIHVDGMTREQAMRLMIEGGFQEEREATGKWVRAQLTSAQLSTYFVGFQEHVAMRKEVERAWGKDFSLRKYHDKALSFGSPPVKYVRALILGEPIPR
jgi:uncharacterized protein (DUF885 family)